MTKHQKEIPTITLGTLRKHLELFPDDFAVSFSGLQFYRTKLRGANLVQIEFDEIVYLDTDGKVIVINH